MIKQRLPNLILTLFILAFTFYFSWYSIQRYQTLHAYTADLSLIDQAMWNTLHGRFLEATWGDHQQPRLAEHFEPLLVPLAGLFWLWDDVRILLIVQALALAMGALPAYWLAKRALKNGKYLPLLFPLLYLLSPPLQAAAVADFHADPFVVAPLLFTFWYATEKRWGWTWFWAIVVMLVKENMPTLIVMLGLGLVIHRAASVMRPSPQHGSGWLRHAEIKHGLLLILVGAVWFAIATFVIVAPLARTYFATGGPVYLANRFPANPLDWPPLLRDPARWRYLLGLLATTGGLALLAPQYLFLGLPIFVANTFSTFPGQFSGEQHYSAPLVAVLMIAAIYGTENLFRVSRFELRASGAKGQAQRLRWRFFAVAVLVAFSYHLHFGWTPFARRAETYAVTPHTRLLPRLLAQIPVAVPISASAAVHPHLAHRPVAYTFPTVKEALFVLVDVTDVPGVHPNDVRATINKMLASGNWQLLDAVDGFVLLKKAPGNVPQRLPDSFFTFARVSNVTPQYPLNVTFGNQIRLLGYDVLDQPFHRRTSVRLYWQALQSPLSTDLRVWPQFYTTAGHPLTNPVQQPAIETVWFPPAAWQTGEIVATTTLPQSLGNTFHLAVAVVHGDKLADFAQRLPVAGAKIAHDQGTWATVASFRRDGWALKALPPTLPLSPLPVVDAEFAGGLRLTGARLPASPHPANEPLTVTLRWETTAPLPVDYTIFLHLIDNNGRTVAQSDSQPQWLIPLPMTRWNTNTPLLDTPTVAPPLPPGKYHLQLGLYNWQTGARLPLVNGDDAVEIGDLEIGD